MLSGQAAWRAFCPSYDGTGYVAPVQAVRDAQVQVVPEGLRFEVKHGDVYRDYSDSRALITGPGSVWEDAGNERWYAWRAMWPSGWVGSYPKWDELFPGGHRSRGGSSLIFHHEPLGGGVEHGSAPIYVGGDDVHVWMDLVDQATSEPRKSMTLAAPLQRGHWYNFLLHFVWSPDPAKGLIEAWTDGVNMVPAFHDQTMYPQTRIYPVAGLYRNAHIGDPGLRWPSGVAVYPKGDGEPAFMFSGGFARGSIRAEVDRAPPSPPPPPALTVDPVKAMEGLQILIDEKARLISIREELDERIAVIGALLDKGPW